jgi:hypothetical protein
MEVPERHAGGLVVEIAELIHDCLNRGKRILIADAVNRDDDLGDRGARLRRLGPRGTDLHIHRWHLLAHAEAPGANAVPRRSRKRDSVFAPLDADNVRSDEYRTPAHGPAFGRTSPWQIGPPVNAPAPYSLRHCG